MLTKASHQIYFACPYSVWDISSVSGMMQNYKYYLSCFLVLVLFRCVVFDQVDIVYLDFVK